MKTDTKELAAGLRRIADGISFGRPALVANQAADRLEELERELEQERQDRKQAQLDVCRALGERNDARVIIDATLKALPVGYIPAHTPESLPGRVADLVSELGRLTAMIEDPDKVELAMIRGDIAIPDREEFDAIRTPSGYNPSPIDP
jgi:hypothetical protein